MERGREGRGGEREMIEVRSPFNPNACMRYGVCVGGSNLVRYGVCVGVRRCEQCVSNLVHLLDTCCRRINCRSTRMGCRSTI